jgi:hypothetical protein
VGYNKKMALSRGGIGNGFARAARLLRRIVAPPIASHSHACDVQRYMYLLISSTPVPDARGVYIHKQSFASQSLFFY